MSGPLLSLEKLRIEFPLRCSLRERLMGRRPMLRAVDDVDLTVGPGEVVSVVGESGSGKSTLALAAVRLVPVTGGRIVFAGQDVTHLRGAALQPFRRSAQIVFQDTSSSLNPRKSVGTALGEAVRLVGSSQVPVAERVRQLLEQVGLDGSEAARYPHELSGGQRQRVCIARALAAEPQLLVADEPVSALDVSFQAQIINLLMELRQQLGLGMLFISHDLALVRRLSDRVAVMHRGVIVEQGAVQRVMEDPQHDYTRLLLDSIPGQRRRQRKRELTEARRQVV